MIRFMILMMDYDDSIILDLVEQVQSWNKWRSRRFDADDSQPWKLMAHMAKAGVGMQNRNTRRPSRGFAIVTSNDASEFIFGADNTFCFRYKGVRSKYSAEVQSLCPVANEMLD